MSKETDAIWEYLKTIDTGTGTLIDMFHPVGSFFETTDEDFDPNIEWGGTWVLETAGLVHVSGGTGYAVTENNAKDGGSKDAIVPYHRHSVSVNGGGSANLITGGGHHHTTYYVTQNRGSGSTATRNGPYGSSAEGATGIVTSETTHTHALPAHNTNYAGASGNVTNANMMPYKNVYRWYRTA